MNKVAFLLPRAQMIQLARAIASEAPDIKAEFMAINNDTVVEQANIAVAGGTNLIIARGYQALLIKKNVAVPVVELVMTGQEIGLLIKRAKRMTHSAQPRIALVGIRNMFCDVRYFSDIFDVVLTTYFVDTVEELADAAQQAVTDQADVIIGGDIAVGVARTAGVESLFLDCTIDSIRESLRVAKNVLHAQHLEKLNTAQMQTLLEYSFNGIVKLDTGGVVVSFNPVAQKLLGKEAHHILSQHITQVIPNVDPDIINDALESGKERLAAFITINNVAITMNVACIRVNDEITGVILSLQENKRIEQMSASVRREQYLSRHVVQGDFTRIEKKSPIMKEMLEKATLYLSSESPTLICGEVGTEKTLLAQCMHNAGTRRHGPFVEVSAKGVPAELQAAAIFGDCPLDPERKNVSFIDRAQKGTLYIREVECLSLETQYTLFNIIENGVIIRNHRIYPDPVDVRIVCATSCDLKELMDARLFREDLFYLLSALTLRLPPLRQRTEDIESYVSKMIDKYCKQYSKFISLTEGAKKYLCGYQWEGNLIQLEAFCENLVLVATKRRVDEVFAQKVLHELYPVVRQYASNQKPIVLSSPEAAKVLAVYEKFHGNRSLMAKELGISTTTLWRKMKKYAINDDLFSVD